jgi:DNA-binding GntR family transcriptional regulator
VDAPRDTGLYTARGARLEHAYQALKHDLLGGEFALGQRLAEERLSQRYEVSRTPIREALVRLHAERLIERHPDGGYTPTPADLPTARHLYEIRFALEREALDRPARLGAAHDRDELERLRADWTALVPPAPDDVGDATFVLLDEDFHVRLAAAAGNPELVAMLTHVNDRIRPIRTHDFVAATRIRTTIEQHVAIVDALLAGNLAATHAAIDAHFQESLHEVEARAAQALTRMLARARGTLR